MSTARNTLSSLYDHKFAIGAGIVTLGLNLFERSWAISANDHNFIWKVAEYILTPAINTGISVVIGHMADRSDKATVSLNAHSMFYNNKFALSFAGLELAKTLFTHSWGLLNYVRGTGANHSLAWSVIESVLMPLLHSANFGIQGHLVDNVANLLEQRVDENSELLVQGRL